MTTPQSFLSAFLLASAVTFGGLSAHASAAEELFAEKITAAIPLPKSAQTAWQTLSGMANGAKERQALEREFDAQKKIRALRCALLYSPSKTTTREDIVRNLGSSACIERGDEEILAWLGMRRVAVMLKMPPIRPPIASSPREIVHGSYIQEIRMAPRAGVALIWANQSVEIVDLHTNKRILKRENLQSGFPGNFSPNGRLFSLGLGRQVVLVDSETGENVTSLASNYPAEMFWLDDRVATFVHATTRRMMLVDFRTGDQKKIDALTDSVFRVAALPKKPGQFVMFSSRSAMRVSVESDGIEPKFTVIAEKPFQVQNVLRGQGALSSDGKYYVNAPGNIAITSVESLDTEIISVAPLDVSRVTTLPDGNAFLLSGSFPNGGMNGFSHYAYSISNHTLALVDRGKQAPKTYVFVPSENALAEIAENRVSIVGEMPLQPPESVTDFVARAKEELRRKNSAPVSAAPAVPPRPRVAREYTIVQDGDQLSLAPVVTPQNPGIAGTYVGQMEEGSVKVTITLRCEAVSSCNLETRSLDKSKVQPSISQAPLKPGPLGESYLRQVRLSLKSAREYRPDPSAPDEGKFIYAQLKPLLESSIDVSHCVDLNYGGTGASVVCALASSPWGRPAVIFLGADLSNCRPNRLFCGYGIVPLFQSSGAPKAGG